MRLIALVIVWAACGPVFSQPQPIGELETIRGEATKAREAAALDPTITDAASPPVVAYLAEQKRRRLMSLAGLRQRIDQAQQDPTKESLVPILKEQLAEINGKPLEAVSFDSAYHYAPTTGLVGYSKKVRLLENTSDGQAVIQVENIALRIAGLGTSQYASGKFLGVPQAILIGPEIPEQMVLGIKRVVYQATLVDLESVLKTPARTKS